MLETLKAPVQEAFTKWVKHIHLQDEGIPIYQIAEGEIEKLEDTRRLSKEEKEKLVFQTTVRILQEM